MDAATDETQVPPPFRFIASLPVIGADRGAWQAQVERIDALGYAGVSVSDHVIGGWSMDVAVALAAAAMASPRLRLLTLVVANDYRHPVLLHRMIAALDVLSAGRVELGIGTGWWPAEYDALGLTLDPPPVRVARLEAAIHIIDRLFRGGAVDFEGEGYRIRGVVGSPAPVQHPRPPIMVGGGSRAILALAGRRADVAAIFPARGADGRVALAQLSLDAMAARIAMVRDAAASAGRPPDAVRFQLSLLGFDLTADDGTVRRGSSSVAPEGAIEAARAGDVVGILCGTVDEACQRLEAWRRELGFSDIHVGSDIEAFAPIVARLAGHQEPAQAPIIR